MRILIAPDKFKGTLTATEAAAAMRRGVECAARELGIAVEVDECPVADGGEGTLEAIAKALPVRRHRDTVFDEDGCPYGGHWISLDPAQPLRDRFVMLRSIVVFVSIVSLCAVWFQFLMLVQAWVYGIGFRRFQWAVLITGLVVAVSLVRVIRLTRDRQPSRGRTAFLEVADVIGTNAIRPEHRDPEQIGTRPVAGLIHAALGDGCGRILLGLGGSLSVDGGTGVGGMTHAFKAGDINMPFRLGATLQRITRIEKISSESNLRNAEFLALCDVQNPLLGPRGAARMFAPQKGATPEQVERLEAGLENLVRVCRECGIPCDPDQPGAGAAGGLGFGLATFLGAKLVPGAPYILDLLNFDERCARADLVLTGEGKMDMQTAEGKACAEVAKRAERAGKPCIAVVGTTEGSTEHLQLSLASRGIRFELIRTANGGLNPVVSEATTADVRLAEATEAALSERLRNRNKG